MTSLEEAAGFYDDAPDAPAVGRAPFRFLDAYEREDREFFFGREAEIHDLHARFYRTRVFVVYGESGAGKTSLLQCGLANAIPAEDAELHFVRCHVDPIASIEQRLGSDGAIADRLEARAHDASRTIALIFDQFEELFLFQPPEIRDALLAQLRLAIDRRLDVRFIFCLREEFLSRMTEVESVLPDVFASRFWLRRMHARDARAVIEAPCRRAGIALEDGLATTIIARLGDARGEIDLPYLQIILDRLYRNATARGGALRFTAADLEALGTIDKVLAAFLDERVEELPDPALGREVLKVFVTAARTRKAVDLDSVIRSVAPTQGHVWPPVVDDTLTPRVTAALTGLVQARILRREHADAPYELRHDTLAEAISRWLTPLEEELVKLRFLVESRYNEFRTTGVLIQDLALITRIEEHADRLGMSPEMAAFVAASRAAASTSSRARTRMWFLVAAIIGAVIIGLTVWGVQQMLRLRRYDVASDLLEARTAELRRALQTSSVIVQTLSAERKRKPDPDRLLALLRVAYDAELSRYTPQLAALNAEFVDRALGAAHVVPGDTVAATRDGRSLVRRVARRIERVDVETGVVASIEAPEGRVLGVAAGARVVAFVFDAERAGEDAPCDPRRGGRTLVVALDVETLKSVRCRWDRSPSAIAVSDDGARIALGSNDGEVVRLERGADKLAATRTTVHGKRAIERLGFTARGLVVASREGVFVDGEQPLPGSPGTDDVLRPVAWSPDGTFVAVGAGSVHTWSEGKPHELAPGSRATALAVSDAWLAIGSEDGSVGVVDRTGAPVDALRVRGAAVRALAFLPGGALAIGDADGGVRLWLVETRQVEALPTGTESVDTVTVAGRHLFVSTGVATRIWPVRSARYDALAKSRRVWWLGDGMVAVSRTKLNNFDLVEAGSLTTLLWSAQELSERRLYTLRTGGNLAGVPVRWIMLDGGVFRGREAREYVDRTSNMRVCDGKGTVVAELPYPTTAKWASPASCGAP